MAESKQNASTALPKNIRQIGTSTGSTRVYLEDYVYTYLHKKEEEQAWVHRGFLLLGRLQREKDFVRYFISGLIRVKDEYFKEGILVFDDEAWAYIYQEMKKYYDDLEIVGWGQDVSGASASLTAELERNHKQNFNIQKNVLFLLDQVEGEEAFYIFEKNMLQRREGYYVYYEKNPQMQEYMVETNRSRELDIPLEEIQEPLVHTYRETLLDKKAQAAARKWNGVLYTTSMLLVLAVCVLGVSTVNNVEKMQNLETAVNQISGQVGQAVSQSADVGASPAMSTKTQQVENGQGDTSVDDKEGTDLSGIQETEGSAEKEQESGNGDVENVENPADADTTDQAEEASAEDAALTEVQTCLLQGYYIVKKGDSLVGISKKLYGTPKKAKKICDLNGIEDMDKIYAGQKLDLP